VFQFVNTSRIDLRRSSFPTSSVENEKRCWYEKLMHPRWSNASWYRQKARFWILLAVSTSRERIFWFDATDLYQTSSVVTRFWSLLRVFSETDLSRSLRRRKISTQICVYCNRICSSSSDGAGTSLLRMWMWVPAGIRDSVLRTCIFNSVSIFDTYVRSRVTYRQSFPPQFIGLFNAIKFT
jgi:hypothetical protein